MGRKRVLAPRVRRRLQFALDGVYVYYTVGCARCGCIPCRGSLTEQFRVSAAGIPKSKEAMHHSTRFDQCFARRGRCYHPWGQPCRNRRGGGGRA